MDHVTWDNEKDRWLIQQRGISFTAVVEAILNHQVIITPHPSPKYPHQHIFYFLFHDYAYACPFVIKNHELFLKTIYPSREAYKIIKELVK
jgi:hypothetical protein